MSDDPQGPVLLCDDPVFRPDEDQLKFRLTYAGPLYADSHRKYSVVKSRAEHKHEIRRAFHRQIKRLWQVSPTLRANEKPLPAHAKPTSSVFGRIGEDYKIATLANRFSRFGYRFVPLAPVSLDVLCGLDILLLSNGDPKGIIQAGDIDNRIKTLIDALKMPSDAKEVGKYVAPENGEDPFFVLLENDSLISRVSVENDVLLHPVKGLSHDVRVVIQVTLWPYQISVKNLPFA